MQNSFGRDIPTGSAALEGLQVGQGGGKEWLLKAKGWKDEFLST